MKFSNFINNLSLLSIGIFVLGCLKGVAPSNLAEKICREKENPETHLTAIAENGTIRPNEFHIFHLAPSTLTVQAKDKDYTFDVKGGGIHEIIRKGETRKFRIDSLGVGTSNFNCGPGCEGKIHSDRGAEAEAEPEDC